MPMIKFDEILAAQQRIKPHIRYTPIIPVRLVKEPHGLDSLFFKLENLQICGSFKARGAVSKLLSLAPEQLERGIVTASGGNHGLGVAYAGWIAQTPVRIYLPHSTPQTKADKLRGWGAEVIYDGAVWDDANRTALAVAAQENMAYFHPFADPLVIAGQGTIGLEIMEVLTEVATVVVAIGGGGLISGISTALKTLKPGVKVIGVEAVGAPTLYESRRAGQLVELAEITTAAGTLAPRRSEQINLDIINQYVDDIVLVSDDDMVKAARWLWFELGIAVELSAAATLAAIQTGQITSDGPVCALICGAGTDGIPA